MANKEIERKIAVIFATDVVGSSKSVEVNEEQTIKNFRACKKILEDLFKEHDGRIFNTAGDSVLAEFSSAVSAVICLFLMVFGFSIRCMRLQWSAKLSPKLSKIKPN